MFKKRSRRIPAASGKVSNATLDCTQKKINTVIVGGNDNDDEDTDADHDFAIVKKRQLNKGLTFVKKNSPIIKESTATTTSTEENQHPDADSESTHFNQWYLEDSEAQHASYYENFDDDDLDNIDSSKSNSKLSITKPQHNKGQDRYGDGQHPNNDRGNDGTSQDMAIMVHRLTPPFLDSNLVLTSMTQISEVIKDKSGDLYRYSKNGSTLLTEKRKKNEYLKNTKENIESDSKISKIVNSRGKSVDDTLNDGNDNGDGDIDDENADFLDRINSVKATNLSNKENLPAYKVKDNLLELINENQVVIVIGETGSGKTTQLPQILYNDGYTQNGMMVGITQPRRMAAVTVAKRVSDEMNVKLGEEVGFTVRFNDVTSSSTNIKFMTDGILLRETLNDANLNKYSCIIMDEAHERSLNTDILFGIFKKVLARRRDFKLIITSATMNSQKFSRFFNNAVQFKIPGKTYPVEIMYQSIPTVDYIDSAVKQALKIHLSNPFQAGDNGDILIFMTGQEDIEATCEILQSELEKLQKINKKIPDLDVLPIYSSLSSNLQSKIFQNTNNRKCIVATNIAETSLTLHHVKFVVDSGLMKLKVYNPKLNMDTLQLVPISKAQANQRSGRAGRVCPGVSYRLYTLSSYNDEMWDEPIPEIQRSNLMNTILLLKNLNIEDVSKFPFIDRPSSEATETSQYELWSIGALDDFGELTELGKKMARFPIDPFLSKMLIISNESRFSCCAEMVKIIAMLSVPPVYMRLRNDSSLQKKVDKIREQFQIEHSDHLSMLNIYNQFCNLEPARREAWCSKNSFNYKSLKTAIDVKSQLEEIVLKSLGSGANAQMKLSSCEDQWEIIKECVCASFFSNAAEFFKHGQYKHCRTGLEMYFPSTSSLYGQGDMPKYVVFHELILTGQRQQMNCVTAVKPEWLVEYGGIFYNKRVRGVSSRENQQLCEEEFKRRIEKMRSSKD